MQVKESRDGDGWFDIRDELSAPTVVYVKWREGDWEREADKRNTNRALFEQIQRRTRTADGPTAGEKMTLEETAVGEMTRKESRERDKAFISYGR